jgi:signal transduction histidine kinase
MNATATQTSFAGPHWLTGTKARVQEPKRTQPSGFAVRPVVLIVDDTPAHLLAFEGMLRREDVEIVTADSGQAALEILLQRDVAVAIIDVEMPEIDGFELATMMRGVQKTRYVPIIFVTAGAPDEAQIFKGYDVGAVSYLFKPVVEHVLRAKVDAFVEHEKHRQELREADRMREMFIAVLGHDLRNPLGGILMSAELIEPRLDGDDSNDAIAQRIRLGCGRISRMVEQLLDATRLRRDGNVELLPEPADLRALADQILDEFEGGAGRVRLEVFGDTVGTWDVGRVLQVLCNIIGNAFKHSPPGSPVLVCIDGSSEGTLSLRVHNGGDPILEEQRRFLFEPFRRASLPQRGDDGLGLGLYIAKRLVDAHGGVLSFTSTAQGGTCFTATLPRHLQADKKSAPKIARAAVADVRAPRTILVVEDDSAYRLALRDLLQRRGYRVLSTGNPSQAIEAAAAHTGQIDLLLSDVHLPDMGGETLAERLRMTHPSLRVVFMSGLANPPAAPTALIQKPIDSGDLARVLQDALGGP